LLTSLTVRNFKRFREAKIDLGNPVVFVGPNDSGKTTALQALALWGIGVKRWNEKRAGKSTPEKRPGVTINRRDLIAVPVPDANLLWRDLHVRDVRRTNDHQETLNVRIDVVVEGLTSGREWRCGLEFDYANEESFYCRPLRLSDDKNPDRMPVPPEAGGVDIRFLPPMSGLSDREFAKQPGEISFLLGQGRTAEVLRNLSHRVVTGQDGERHWDKVCRQIRHLFGVGLDKPSYRPENSEIIMTYGSRSGRRLDLSSSGRGMQQTLLLLVHLAAYPGSVLLLDEPDAHLEILRQRQIYRVLTESAQEHTSQIIIASHSEVVLNEAADRDVVVAFLGSPHRIDDRGSQLLKSLKEIGYDQYYQAEQKGWVLYLEGSTDLAILQAFAQKLEHTACHALEQPFVHYVQNQPARARSHFRALREAKRDLVGLALFDNLGEPLHETEEPRQRMWGRREIENYLCTRRTLRAWAESEGERLGGGPLFAPRWAEVMDESIQEVESATLTLGRGSPWSPETKVSDNFLDPLFPIFYKRLGLPNEMDKSDYHVLARFVPKDELDPEVSRILDEIAEVAGRATPVRDEERD
jgi:energy-coupling factor transporter ATP-binding protein EcfA2